MPEQFKKTPWRTAAMVILLLIAINALVAGYSFISDPSGKGIGLSPDYIKYSPFSTYLVPGIILFICNGLQNLGAFVLVLKRNKWGPLALAAQGLILCGWISFQVYWVREFNALHGGCLLAGIIMLIASSKLKA